MSRQELLESLKESNLLSAEELERAAALSPGADASALTQAIVSAGILTEFQIKEVANRRFEKLRIGSYDILDKLGAGGMGTVYKARHRILKRVRALKVLPRNLCKDKTFVQRFQREMETLAQFNHPNIVMAHDAGEAKVGHFLAMEFVDGQDLDSLVRKQGPMRLADAVSGILQAARGLEYVHGHGMIHRDIKPANLLRDANGVVKVTDLGLTRLIGSVGESGRGLTQAGGMLGTVDYMPPEQALDPSSADHRADIYSLGATLYFLLTGQPPYQGQTMMDTLFKHREAPLPSLTAARPDAPPALDDIYQRMMAKAPADRFQSMSEVVRALETLGASFGDNNPVFAPGQTIPVNGFNATLAAGPRANMGKTMTGAPAASNQTMVAPPVSTERGPALKVLLVEPSRTQAAIIRKQLQDVNIQQVVTVGTGQEALKAVASERPQVILSRLHLDDMTGVQLAQQVRADHPSAGSGFVLISSDETQSAEVGRLSLCGQAVLLQKPFTPEKLIETLSLVTGLSLPPKPLPG